MVLRKSNTKVSEKYGQAPVAVMFFFHRINEVKQTLKKNSVLKFTTEDFEKETIREL